MNLPLIALITLLGIGMGLAELAGLIPHGLELVLWCVIAVIAALVIGRVTQRRFLNGLAAGFLAWAIANWICAVFFDTYVSRNPTAAQSFAALPAGMSPRLLVAILAPILAIGYGLLVGGLSAVAGKILGRRAPATV